MRRRLLALGFVFLLSGASLGRDAAEPRAQPQSYPAVSILSTGTNIIGEPIRYPTTGPAHITAAIVTLAPGQKTSVHKHGVPLFAYILEGELTVDMPATRSARSMPARRSWRRWTSPISASTAESR
jgi:hypothetical protein